ncbi:hypothetical protein SPRG_16554 [Saprolegnia parasitica CBS 223.65]|uniref:Uncharacterized protein n=1 Tax=Saprolegnia parasitica (strain CBS 223.65) TaxID=695850 RepID=A0A067BUE7_SAPPC|nr:hypothetical protein SPRG_16554 [Saprolegnia parasitica CBS 223.65]KDO17916.1 hypothetical protein SPRG_16554 [Saprolegnia parasitica CBS 223.65]|eukprot:XP_012211373.1 hypothetical protein SPRG_16554 [Saprolegnia parasitica CBS 223.65]
MLRGAAGLAFAMGAATASFRSGTYICDTWNAWNCFPTVPTIVRWSDNGIDVECMSTDGKTCLPTTTPDACIQHDSAANAAALRYAGANHQCGESIHSVADCGQAPSREIYDDALLITRLPNPEPVVDPELVHYERATEECFVTASAMAAHDAVAQKSSSCCALSASGLAAWLTDGQRRPVPMRT